MKRTERTVATISGAAAVCALALALTACNGTGKPAATKTRTNVATTAADPGKKLERLASATLGEPSSIKPNAGAMALCDDNKIKVRNVNFTGVRGGFTALKGAKGEDCIIRVSFDARATGSKGMVLVLATERGLHASGLFAQPTFATGLQSSSDIKVPDDSTLTILFQNPKRPAGMQVVTNKNEEPNSRAFQVANTPVYRQLVAK